MNNKMRNLFYIGLNGYAGSGKDSVAKMLKTILSYEWENIEECKEFYNKRYKTIDISATYNKGLDTEGELPVICIAFADQLKKICSSIFGIPIDRFYKNKSNAWVCINNDFKYTEIKPNENYILTSEEYYDKIDFYKNIDEDYWLSLRDILVYIGTYVCQRDINQNIFVNIVENTIKESCLENNNLEYAIVTDVRFYHELNYIRRHNGITINIVRDTVQQLDNIAEHDLDEEYDYDYTINNSGTYDELFQKVWDLVHNNIEFNNETIQLVARDNVNNYLRLIKRNNNEEAFKLCTDHEMIRMSKSDGDIIMIDPAGGPAIYVDEKLQAFGECREVSKIEFPEESNQFIITTIK